jgi:hypothetical protein
MRQYGGSGNVYPKLWSFGARLISKVSKFHGIVPLLPRYSVRQSRRGKRTDESTGLLVIQHSTYQQHHRGPVGMYSKYCADPHMHDHLDLPISALHLSSLVSSSPLSAPFRLGTCLPPAAQQWTWPRKIKVQVTWVLLSTHQVLRPQMVSASRRTRRLRYRSHSHRREAGLREYAGRASAELLFYHPGREPHSNEKP